MALLIASLWKRRGIFGIALLPLAFGLVSVAD